MSHGQHGTVSAYLAIKRLSRSMHLLLERLTRGLLGLGLLGLGLLGLGLLGLGLLGLGLLKLLVSRE